MFPTTLTAAQLDKLRGAGDAQPSWRGTVYLSLCPNAVVWKTQVASAPSGNVFAAIQHGATLSGSASNVQAGMTILSGAVDDVRQATWRGRVRGAVSGGLIPINETSYAFQPNDYIWVIEDYAIHIKLARDTGANYFKDWDKTFAQLPPVIHNLQSAYVGFVSGSPLGLTIPFNAQAYAATQGASIVSWQWTVPSGVTLVAGSATSPNPTYRFNAGFAGWISVQVTDSGGRTARRRIFVAAHDRASHAPRSGFGSVNVSADLENGYSATLTAFDPAEFDAVLDNTFAVLWIDEAYNDAAGSLLGETANILCVGRLRRETLKGDVDERAALVTQSEIEIEGVAAQLARLHAPKIAIRNAATPTQWDEVNTLTLWRAVIHTLAEHSTFLDLHSLTFDDTSNTFRVMQLATQDGNLLGCINDIMESINARIEFAPDGTARGVRDPRYLSTTARNALPTVINFNMADLLDVSVSRDHAFSIGRCEASGGSFNSVSNTVTPMLSLAPGHAQDDGEGSTTLGRQVLAADVTLTAAQNELNVRCGHHLETQRRRFSLNATHPDGYAFMVPSNAAWYTFTFSFPERDISYTTSTRWTCQSVTTRYDENGTRSVSASYQVETRGVPGKTVTYPAPTAIPINMIDLPPLESYPGFGIVEPVDSYTEGTPFPIDTTPRRPALPTDGNTVATWSNTRLFVTTNFIAGGDTPDWTEITPPLATNGTIRAFAWDRFNVGAAYCMVDDGTETSIYYTPDALSSAWQLKSTVGGIYTVLRTTQTAGGIYIYSALSLGSATVTQTFTATFDPGGAAYNIIAGTTYGGGNPGNAHGDELPAAPPSTIGTANATIDIPLPSGATALGMALDYKHGWDDGGDNIALNCVVLDASFNPILGPGPSGIIGTRTTNNTTANTWRSESVTFAPPKSGAAYARFAISWYRANGEQRKVYIDNCSITFESTVGSGARTAYSPNYGVSWVYQVVGAGISDEIGGFAVQPVGSHSYAAADGQVREATSNGGAYSNDGAPLTGTAPRLLWIPRRQWNSATLNTGANPHYLVGAGALVSGEAFWRDSGTRTAITPVHSSVKGVAISPNCAVTWSGHRIALIANFGGIRRLMVSTNAGNAWTHRGALSATADYIRYLPASNTGNEIFFVDGAVARYSADHGATLRTKAVPNVTVLRGIEPL